MVKKLAIAGFTLCFLAICGVLAGYVHVLKVARAPSTMAAPMVVDIPGGSSLTRIARQFAEIGLVSHPFYVRAYAVVTGLGGDLKAGEYLLPAEISLADAFDKLIRNDVLIHTLTIPEGLTSQQILALIRADRRLDGPITEYIREGDLLPETYGFPRGHGRDVLIREMKRAHNVLLDELWANAPAGLPFSTPEEAVVLASIVEKETAVAAERGQVAGVFLNRLQRGMRLQSDPTVIYGLDPTGRGLGRGLRASELKAPTPYNTYVIRGLPPGPICHPGEASLRAVFDPEPTTALYFVADGTGGHVFADTLAEHNRNVARWRRIERERAAQE